MQKAAKHRPLFSYPAIDRMMGQWILTFTPRGKSGTELGRFSSRDDAMIAGEKHFEDAGANDDEFGWQMSFNGATAVTSSGAYRVRRL